jgi:hypothetical protein
MTDEERRLAQFDAALAALDAAKETLAAIRNDPERMALLSPEVDPSETGLIMILGTLEAIKLSLFPMLRLGNIK